jgi:hypothetical protein
MDERDDYGEPAPPVRPVKMAAVFAIASGIVVWCVVAITLLARMVGR